VRTLKPAPGNFSLKLAATLPQGGRHDVLADMSNSSNGEQPGCTAASAGRTLTATVIGAFMHKPTQLEFMNPLNPKFGITLELYVELRTPISGKSRNSGHPRLGKCGSITVGNRGYRPAVTY
jgi:hypothetical protein